MSKKDELNRFLALNYVLTEQNYKLRTHVNNQNKLKLFIFKNIFNGGYTPGVGFVIAVDEKMAIKKMADIVITKIKDENMEFLFNQWSLYDHEIVIKGEKFKLTLDDEYCRVESDVEYDYNENNKMDIIKTAIIKVIKSHFKMIIKPLKLGEGGFNGGGD